MLQKKRDECWEKIYGDNSGENDRDYERAKKEAYEEAFTEVLKLTEKDKEG